MRVNRFLFTLLGFLALSQLSFAEAQVAASPASHSAKKIMEGVKAANTGNAATQQIEKTVHQYLMKKPEVVVEALQAYQQKQMESMQQLFKDTQKLAPQYADVLFHHQPDPMGGNANGKITVVEFSDYQCSHCIETATVIDSIIKANSNLRVVIKEFPIRGPVSETAARAALAANKQGKYWEFRATLFKNSSSLTADKILELAQGLGMNMDQLKKDMDDPAIRKEIEANQTVAKSLKLVGTPAFFVAKSDIQSGAPANSINYVPGIVTQQQLQTLIDQLH